MTQTTRQKLAADINLAWMVDHNLPDPVKLSPGLEATEDYPVLHMEWTKDATWT